MDGPGCGGEGGVLGGEGGHVLSWLVTEGLRARDRGRVRLQWNQVSHLELQRAGAADRQAGAAAKCKIVQDVGQSEEKCIDGVGRKYQF